MIYCYSLLIIILTLLSSSIVQAKNILNHNGNILEIYGSINPNHELSHVILSPEIKSHRDNSIAIIGLSGETQITDIFSSYFHLEYNSYLFFPENTKYQKKNNNLSLGYAGIKYSNLGSIDYGRNYGVMHDVQSFTNRIPYIIKNSIFENSDKYMMNKNNSLITYRNDNIFDLLHGASIILQYQNKNDDRSLEDKSGPGWGAALKYKNDIGLTVMGAFFSSNKSYFISNNRLKPELVEAYGLGLKYDIKNLYLGAFYGTAYNMTPYKNFKNDFLNRYINITQNIELVAEYNFDPKFNSTISYLNSEGKNIDFSAHPLNKKNVLLAEHVDISARYKIHKNFSTYLNYKINLLKKNEFIINNNINIDNTVSVGIVYQF